MTFRSALGAMCLFVTGSAAGADCTRLGSLDWLAGTWRATTESRVVTETWWRVSDETLEGLGRTRSRQDGELVASEALRLVSMLDSVFYLAMVEANRLPVPFRMTDCGADFARFDNPDHDFPRRLAYRLTRAAAPDEVDRLRVDVSDGADSGFSLHFSKISP